MLDGRAADVMERALKPLRLAGFSTVCVALSGALLPVALYLPQFYARDMGLGLGVTGLIFMAVRLVTTLADPIIGWLSDRTTTRFGRRKPWIAAGSVLYVVGAVALFTPPAGISGVYLALSLSVFCFGCTMILTPFYAWSGDLTKRYHGRTLVQTYLQTATAIGLMLVLLVPAVQEHFGGTMTGKIHLLGIYVIAIGLIGLPLVLIVFKEQISAQPPQQGKATWASGKALLFDPLVLKVMGSDFFVAIGQGIRGALFMFFVAVSLGMPQWASLLMLLQTAAGILASPLWLKVSYRLGKQRTIIAAEIAQVIINLLLLAVTRDRIWLMVILVVIQGLAQNSGNLMLRTMVADLADTHRTKTGQECSGVLFSIFNVTYMAASAIAVGLAFPLIGWFGFVAKGTNTPEALTALQIVFAVGPALGHTLSAFLILRFPREPARTKEANIVFPSGAVLAAPTLRSTLVSIYPKRRVA